MDGHEHRHAHDESCTCGHAHEHAHDESCGCGHEHAHDKNPFVECRLHDEARVISGRLTLSADETTVKAALSRQLEALAALVQLRGGIVGHIKASCRSTAVEMFSVTDTAVSSKKAPEQELEITLAAIVFFVDPDAAEAMVKVALEEIKATAIEG